MLGFPTPYSNELLYSTIARAGVHDGETSPKQLLDSIFANRKVIATIDLPSHIQDIANQYPKALGLDANKLIEMHTLWPIYAPFIPRDRRIAIAGWMREDSQGAAHLATGIAASRVQAKKILLMCPGCVHEQELAHGEGFWDRRWHVPLVKYCPKHGPLIETDIKLNGSHRHAFMPISEASQVNQFCEIDADLRFSRLAYQLFDIERNDYPSYEQWSLFYKQLAVDYGFQTGKRVEHQKITSHFQHYWNKDWLTLNGLAPSNKETSWLRSIFQKHRKSFSFAEHLTVIDAISFTELNIERAIELALSYPVKRCSHKEIPHEQPEAIHQDQKTWLILLNDNTPKAARALRPALYARLYRNHYLWLMQVNAQNHAITTNTNKRVDRASRDRKAAKELMKVFQKLDEDLSIPRMSKSYLLQQLSNKATIEKNLYRLPRTRTLLENYSESVDEYQARRLVRVLISTIKSKQPVKAWSLLREAGLSDERITNIVKKLLDEILENDTWRDI
ncbi:hypothetical protein tloyanaT_23300 [Thalassotalea loyana]|uniref:Transposase n=1 Tax=Thalassotalea loyana TaxID=280483 RepID=A0ABQ6HEV7_9GAMM|nr:TnsD family Tn7-like transposition protein [Thalassotalea loyana]GLX86077.1 hypothetical protein tloyanaT_23300 [Thalassotalea loyana]